MTVNRKNKYLRPGSFWCLTFHSNSPELRHIETYEMDSVAFNYTDLMQGQPYTGTVPLPLRLILSSGRGPLADHLASPMGLTVMSDRLLHHVMPLIHECVELLPAPLYEHSGEPVQGYQIVNVVKIIDCVDREVTPKDLEHYAATDACIDPVLAGGAHMFKFLYPSGKVDFGVTCSYEFVRSLERRGFTGLAFIPYEMRDEGATGSSAKQSCSCGESRRRSSSNKTNQE